jgi:malonyl CoA-acyl carrier protein transacylase/acyl carrier protein
LEGTEKDAHLETLASKVRLTVATHHEILTDAVVFIRKGSIYKTSSGKIQRHACRKAYLEGELEIIGQWESSAPKAVSSRTSAAATAGPPTTQASQIREWLFTQIAERMGLNPQDIDPKLPFQNFGLDSKEAVNLSGDLETLLDRRLSPTLLWQYPSIEALSNYLGQEQAPEDAAQRALVKRRIKPKVAFLFTGQGSQYPGMGLKLYERGGRFREVLEECDQFLTPLLGRSIKRLMLGFDSELALLHETAFTQPALFALEIALAEQFKAWGIEPDFVMGHSVGEYVAACVAGIFSKEEGLKLIAERGRLMQELPKVGAMLAARIGETQALERLAPYAEEVSIAAVNGPRSVVFSGKKEKIDALERNLAAAGIGVQALNVSHAFHSPLMDSILSPFEERAHSIPFKAPRIPVISNLTGRILESGEISAAYWRRHLRETVRFSDGIRSLADMGCEIFTELGPKPVLGCPLSTPAGRMKRVCSAPYPIFISTASLLIGRR